MAVSRLEAMAVLPIHNWRFHDADIPHGEDPSLNDSSWQAVDLDYSAQRGNSGPERGWHRATVEVPSNVGGKDISGARLKPAVRFSKDGRVFLNGGLVAQGGGRTLDPILVTNKAVSGQKIQIAIKVPFHEGRGSFWTPNSSWTTPASLIPASCGVNFELARPFPVDFRREEQSARKNWIMREIDFAALDKGGQEAFTHSLDTAQKELQPLNAWMKQFTVRLVGNSHIDMAWLWPGVGNHCGSSPYLWHCFATDG